MTIRWIFLSYLISYVSGGILSAPVGCSSIASLNLGLCSSRGRCVLEQENGTIIIITEPDVPNSKCVCFNGWTGFNDYTNMDTHDCGQSLIAIRIIWIVLLFLSIAESIVCIRKLYQSYLVWQDHLIIENSKGVDQSQSTETGESGDPENTTSLPSATPSKDSTIPKSTSKTHWTVPFQWPVVICAVIALFSMIPFIALCFIRMVAPTEAIGSSSVASWLYVIYDANFVVAERIITLSWLNVQSKLLKFTEKDEQTAREAISRLRLACALGFFFDFCRYLCIILIYVLPGYSQILAWLSYNLINTVMCISTFSCIQAGTALTAILQNGIESLPELAKKERERVLKTIDGVIKEFKQAVALPLIIFTLVAWWPFLRSHISYVMGFHGCMHIAIMGHLSGLQPPVLHQSKISTAPTTPAPRKVSKKSKEKPPIEKDEKESLALLITPEQEEEKGKTSDVELGKRSPSSPSAGRSGREDLDENLDSSSVPLTPSTTFVLSSSSHNSEPLPLFNPFQ